MRFLLLLTLAGCVPLHVCPDAQAVIIHVPDGRTYLGFDAENLVAWSESLRMEAKGECAWPKEDGI